jgi:hypothetical protein
MFPSLLQGFFCIYSLVLYIYIYIYNDYPKNLNWPAIVFNSLVKVNAYGSFLVIRFNFMKSTQIMNSPIFWVL